MIRRSRWRFDCFDFKIGNVK